MFARFQLHLSIAGFLVVVYLLRLLNLWCIACFIMLVSKMCNRIAQATLVSTAMFVVPSVMYAILGYNNFKPFALSIPASVMGMLVDDVGAMGNCIITALAMIFFAVASIALVAHYDQNALRL